MKNNTLILAIILFIFSFQVKAQVNISNINLSQHSDSLISILVNTNKDVFEFELINNTSDSLYLFDSYLNENAFSDIEQLYNARYLHRFDRKENQCKLSFLPLIPYLSVERNDLYIIGENRLIRKGQILYSFKSILPHSKLCIKIPKESFYQEKYIKEVDTKKMSKFDKKMKIKNIDGVKCDNIVVEFAVYKNINIINNFEAYYYNEFEFNEQVLSYSIISVLINL
ncbi:hypothetical protein M2451_004019 [Dysgonomonas sp. PFB1-18]|uniref:hypothetical protein n=1 Tax=unclassified Dysgonomonas TaxID=2630389 RepID=UPI0024739DD7|nr:MULTISPECIES: hypothetical protein [unclassified Dysgonomonas]MDH6310475.1 hypothetical protein [Dysgonomonas sp. PF1-14]MDH6340913.1 hypothetical protein [Dysgonomonas sp. PF1-16]MDH6382672.1 hypothetical protein [Dysgonomonas sp. PFB1-18]MDH6399892.1 hypothetical protein [Dysgonomonas sp. PF1-23]